MSNYIGATHNQFEDSTFHGGQHWSTIIHYHGDGSQDSHDRERSREVLKPLEAKLEKNSFLALLLPMTNHVEHISKTLSIDPDDPKLYWILRDADFKDWELADNSRVLWLFGGPPGCSITEVSSFIAKQEASRRNDEVFYFSCSKEGSDVITTFAHSVLRHIINGSEPCQAKSIIKTFLSTLLFKIIQRDRTRFRDGHSAITVKGILEAKGSGLLEALTEAVVEMKSIPDAPIVIDGIDKIGPDGARFLTKFCSNSTASPKPKVLLTCRLDPDIKKVIVGTIIEYDKERQECLDSLRHHGTRYDKIETEHHDTLKWLWEHKQYESWSSTPHSDLLLIEGKPGSGKSTLTKYFKHNIERVPHAKKAIVASFFYSHREGELHTHHSNMLRSILYDVLYQNETFFFHFQSPYRLQHGVWSYDSLKDVLLSFKKHPIEERLYLIVDAMDESGDENRDNIIQLLHQLCGRDEGCPCIVKVFVSSRPINKLNHDSAEIKKVIKMQDENTSDIIEFAESFLGELELDDECRCKTTDYILQKAQGVFRWVGLVEKELREYDAAGYADQEIYDFLKSLPTELDSFYEYILQKLENNRPRDIKVGVKIFELVLFAFRPLRVLEIRQALAIPDNIDADYSPSNKSFKDGLIKVKLIKKRVIHCGGDFLEIKRDDIVQFTHQTVITFFSRLLEPTSVISKFRMSEDDARRRISVTCIRYLMLFVARSAPENEPPNTESWEPAHFENYATHLQERPFLDYALSHFEQYKNSYALQLVSQLSERLTNNPASILLESWVNSYLGQGVASENQRPSAKDFRNNMLHTATRMKYSQVVEALLTAGSEKEACVFGKTPLLVSAEAGDVATAEVLLRKGARLDAKDYMEQTALLLAATKGHDTMVSLLVNSGAKKEESDRHKRTALHNAAVNGHDSTVRLLVETLGTDTEARDCRGWTALHHAASNGRDSTVRQLVETLGANIGAKDNAGFTLLHIAASLGNNSRVRLLSTLGASTEVEDSAKRTALHWAAIFGHTSTVELLVNELRANRVAEDRQKHTALHFAAPLGQESTVRQLVNNLHVNKDAKNVYGKTALDITREFYDFFVLSDSDLRTRYLLDVDVYRVYRRCSSDDCFDRDEFLVFLRLVFREFRVGSPDYPSYYRDRYSSVYRDLDFDVCVLI